MDQQEPFCISEKGKVFDEFSYLQRYHTLLDKLLKNVALEGDKPRSRRNLA